MAKKKAVQKSPLRWLIVAGALADLIQEVHPGGIIEELEARGTEFDSDDFISAARNPPCDSGEDFWKEMCASAIEALIQMRSETCVQIEISVPG